MVSCRGKDKPLKQKLLMNDHLFSKVRMARTIAGFQIWFEGSSIVVAMVQSEREARSIFNKLRRMGMVLDVKNRLHGFQAAA